MGSEPLRYSVTQVVSTVVNNTKAQTLHIFFYIHDAMIMLQ